jgi:mannobiose 2-epimerase
VPADALLALCELARAELTERLLPFWVAVANDRNHGGVIGSIAEDGTPDDAAPKGSILHARVLWTFSAAARALSDDAVSRAADRAAAHFTGRFIDRELGGVYWSIDAEGRPLDARKHVYAQAFAIYALAEHFLATGNEGSLEAARSIFELVESRAWDAEHVGYEECFARDWTPLGRWHRSTRISAHFTCGPCRPCAAARPAATRPCSSWRSTACGSLTWGTWDRPISTTARSPRSKGPIF